MHSTPAGICVSKPLMNTDSITTTPAPGTVTLRKFTDVAARVIDQGKGPLIE